MFGILFCFGLLHLSVERVCTLLNTCLGLGFRVEGLSPKPEVKVGSVQS